MEKGNKRERGKKHNGQRKKTTNLKIQEEYPKPLAVVREHPLCNSLVLRNIFQYFEGASSDTLTTFTLVCKTWREEVQNIWQSRYKTVTLLNEDSVQTKIMLGLNEDEQRCWLCQQNQPHSCRMYHDTVTLPLEDFLMVNTSKNGLPIGSRFRKHVLFQWVFKDSHFMQGKENNTPVPGNSKTNRDDSGGAQNEMAFWKIHGPTIASLKLVDCKFPQSFYMFQKRFLEFVPNLKELDIENCDICLFASLKSQYYLRNYKYRHENLESLRIKLGNKDKLNDEWTGILETFPNLTKLTVENGDPNGDSGALLGIIITDLIKPGLGLKINSLDFMNFNFPATAKLGAVALGLAYLNFSLKHLRLDIGYETDYNEIKMGITRHASTLRTLHLFRAPYEPPFRFFPCRRQLPCLEELHMWGNVCESLHFIKRMPQLKTFHWNMSCYDRENDKLTKPLTREEDFNMRLMVDTDIVETAGDRLPEDLILEHVSDLALDCTGISRGNWKRLSRIFPNLKTLQCCSGILSTNLDTVRQTVNTLWAKLEELKVSVPVGDRLYGNLLTICTRRKICRLRCKIPLPRPGLQESPLLTNVYSTMNGKRVNIFSQVPMRNLTWTMAPNVLLHFTKSYDNSVFGEISVLGKEHSVMKRARNNEGPGHHQVVCVPESNMEFLETMYNYIFHQTLMSLDGDRLERTPTEIHVQYFHGKFRVMSSKIFHDM